MDMNELRTYVSRRLLFTLKNSAWVRRNPDFTFRSSQIHRLSYIEDVNDIFANFLSHVSRRFLLATLTRQSYGIRYARFSINGERPRASYVGRRFAYRATIKTGSEPVSCHLPIPGDRREPIASDNSLFFARTLQIIVPFSFLLS